MWQLTYQPRPEVSLRIGVTIADHVKAEIKAGKWPYHYYSILRPLTFWFRLPQTHMAIDRHLWTVEPVSLSDMERYELGPVCDLARGQMVLDYCRREYGEAPVYAFYREQGAYCLCSTVSPSATIPGKWQVTYWDTACGPTGHHNQDTLLDALCDVTCEGFQPCSTDTFDALMADMQIPTKGL